VFFAFPMSVDSIYLQPSKTM